MSDLRLVEVSAGRELSAFIRLPWALHRSDRLWVPPLLRDERRFFDRRRNHAFSYCDATLALAYRGSEPVGRILGIVNHRHNQKAGERTARFGCLECVDDDAVAQGLLGHVEAWARARGLTRCVGPMGFTDQDPEGFLVEGFEHPPTIATCWNRPYVNGLLERAGYAKEVDYVVYRLPVPAEPPEPYQRVLRRSAARAEFQLVEFATRRQLAAYVTPILRLMSETFESAYGFVAPDAEEMRELARQYLPVLDPRFVKVVTRGGEVVGFIVAMPNLASGLRRANGRLFPFGLLHVLRAARASRQLDLLLGGIRARHRGRGIDVMLGAAMMRAARAAGFEQMDSHHELESNAAMRAEMERLGGQVYKRYRIYQRALLT